MSPGRESRPVASGPAESISTTTIKAASGDLTPSTDISAVQEPRCRICKHPLSARVSVARGTGPVCHKQESAELIAEVFGGLLWAC